MGLLAVAMWLAFAIRRQSLQDGGLAVPALFCLWSLAAIYHNINNLILMLPAFAFLWFADPGGAGRERWSQIVCFEAVLMLTCRRGCPAPCPRTLAAFLVEHFDRLLVLACSFDVDVLWVTSRRGVEFNQDRKERETTDACHACALSISCFVVPRRWSG